jgi:hypothetical protein
MNIRTEGYWAFDAVCVIHGIDDSSFRDHIVRHKDLADWARANDVRRKGGPNSDGPIAERLRCEGGQRCPRAGYWMMPAQDIS